MCEIYKNLSLENIDGEIWKDIEEFPNYQVSNMGRVKSFSKKDEGKILKQFFNRGYLSLGLRNKKEYKTFKVHRLVAKAFIPNPENKPQVNHINEDKTDNRAENLEWMTAQENVNYGTGIERRAKAISIPVYEYDKNGKYIKEYKSCVECEIKNGYYSGHCWRCASNNGDLNFIGDKFYSFLKKDWLEPPKHKEFTEEHRKKIATSKTGVSFTEEHKRNISKSRTGFIMSEENKQKRKEKMIENGTYYGKKWTDKQLKERSNLVYQLDEDNNIIQIYNSTKECERTTEFSGSQVSVACRGLRNTKLEQGHKYKGCYWYYQNNLPEHIKGRVCDK